MTRIVSVWLKAWPVTRLLRAQTRRQPSSGSQAESFEPGRPIALVAPATGGPRIVALDEAAERCGLAVGELLSSARSKVHELQSADADPAADDAALRRLALWCLRYTPLAAPWGEESGADGLFLDITGCAHLFGGEKALLADLARALGRFGLRPRLAVADTAGAAWAVARYGPRSGAIVPSGDEERAIADLPPAALRLPEETRVLMARLGFRRIGDLVRQPRGPLAARFGATFLTRLDQVLGRAGEPLSPVAHPPVYQARASFAEAISSQDHVVEAARRLLGDLARDLERDGAGMRRLRLLLFRMDGAVRSLSLGLAAPSRDADHITGLIALRLDRLPRGLEADFGFEAAALHVLAAGSMTARQTVFGTAGGASEGLADTAGLARLVDRLALRLGPEAVRRLVPHESHIPERAIRARPAGEEDGERRQRVASHAPTTPPLPVSSRKPVCPGIGDAGSANRAIRDDDERSDGAREEGAAALRPLLLLGPPEPAEVVALVPEGPPRQFRWRGVLHLVAESEGPERIAPEWWLQEAATATRDYYVVEDTDGRRFWLYRSGLYGAGETRPAWFVHGLFP